jgi:glucosamine kinase
LPKLFYIGVDGGATKCTVRLEDETGSVLGTAVSGPANIRISVPMAWQSINNALLDIFKTRNLTLNDPNCQFHAGVGIAGCELPLAHQAFVSFPHKFHTLAVSNDAHTACLGAHGGRDGSLIIAGTGVAGYQIEGSNTEKVSGWGFPHDDIGSGAWLGLEAVKVALQWQDGRKSPSGLAKAVMSHFEGNLDKLVSWANQANSTAFAKLAPLVVQLGQAGDGAAQNLLRAAAQALDAVAGALQARQHTRSVTLPCALSGGIAPFLLPYLGDALRARIVPCEMPPEAGAILLLRKVMEESKQPAS